MHYSYNITHIYTRVVGSTLQGSNDGVNWVILLDLNVN